MGFTIEDTLTVSQNIYNMKLLAGRQGWSNSIKWILLVEDFTILEHFSGKEMAVTTGLGFDTEERLLRLAETLSARNASALVINTGFYIRDIPPSLIERCDALSLPLRRCARCVETAQHLRTDRNEGIARPKCLKSLCRERL